MRGTKLFAAVTCGNNTMVAATNHFHNSSFFHPYPHPLIFILSALPVTPSCVDINLVLHRARRCVVFVVSCGMMTAYVHMIPLHIHECRFVRLVLGRVRGEDELRRGAGWGRETRGADGLHRPGMYGAYDTAVLLLLLCRSIYVCTVDLNLYSHGCGFFRERGKCNMTWHTIPCHAQNTSLKQEKSLPLSNRKTRS